MRLIALAFLVFGCALAGGAIFFASNYFKSLQANFAQDTGIKTIRIVAAKQKLAYGDQINIDNALDLLQWIEWPGDSLPEGSFANAEDLFGPGHTETRSILRTLEPGELLLKPKVSGFGEGLRVASRLSEGQRAFTIPIDAVSGVAGLITPGDRVDILLTRRIERQPTTTVILQDVLVIATDQRHNTDNARARLAKTATVEVNPTQAAKLTLAQSVGELTLTLRGIDEVSDADIAPIGLEDLPAQPAKPKPAPVKKQTTVRVRRAGQAENIPVD